ncbi:MAG: tetratricopeptide repeat protein [Nitrospinae bacterium]|nr:tetratricopeptide repeat protein [Nitrospinota bacterium]
MRRLLVIFLTAVILTGASPVSVNHAKEGLIRYGAGDYVGAMESFRMARSADMGKAAYMAWGMATLRLEKYRSAAAKFGMASGKDPSDGDPLALMGESYLRDGSPREAIAVFARIGNRPLTDPVGVKILWGVASNGAGAHAHALSLFREAGRTAMPQRRGEIVRGEGAALIGLGRHDEADERLGRYLRENPDDAGALALAGEASLKRGSFDTASRRLRTALDKGAPVGPTAYNLACAESRRGAFDDACAALRRSCAAGFDCATPMRADPDLLPLRDRGCLDRPSPPGGERPKKGGPSHSGGGSEPSADRPAHSQPLSR